MFENYKLAMNYAPVSVLAHVAPSPCAKKLRDAAMLKFRSSKTASLNKLAVIASSMKKEKPWTNAKVARTAKQN